MKVICASIATFLLLSSSSLAGLPRPMGWVSDYAGILNENDIRQITSAIVAIKTTTDAEIAVITQKSLGEFGSIEEMGLAYLEGWGIGVKGKDNGLVLLIVINESEGYRRYRFETGLGLEGDLPDGLLGRIGREELATRFRAGDYGGGILASVVRIGGILGADLNVAMPVKKGTKRRGGIGSIIFFLILMSFLLRGRGRGSGLLALFLLGGMMGPRRGGSFGGGGFGGGFGGFSGGGGGAGGGVTGGW